MHVVAEANQGYNTIVTRPCLFKKFQESLGRLLSEVEVRENQLAEELFDNLVAVIIHEMTHCVLKGQVESTVLPLPPLPTGRCTSR
jgi:hypothetical protein